MIKFSSSLRNYLANAFGVYWGGATMDIYTGSQPDNPATPPTGDLLATISLFNPAFSTADIPPGVISKIDVWSGIVILGGIAGWFRMTAIGYDTTIMIDGSCGEVGDNPDAVLDNKTLVEGGNVVVTVFGYEQPE